LSIQNVFTKKPTAYLQAANDPTRRQELRQRTKKHGEVAGGIAKGYVADCIQRDEELSKLNFYLELTVEAMVKETSDILCGDRHLETALKKSLAPSRGNESSSHGAAGKDNNNN